MDFRRLVRVLGPVSLLSLSACSAPDPAPLDDRALVAAVTERAATPTDLRNALEIAGTTSLALPRPDAPTAVDRDDPVFWTACAYAYDPATRQARRRLQAAIASARSAGAPGAVGVDAEHAQNAGERDTEVALTFDLLGLLGLGRSAAEENLANAEVRNALGVLEDAVWRARFNVARARLRLGAARARVAAFEELLADAAGERERIEILQRNGRLALADTQWARAVLHHAEGLVFQAHASAADAQAELAKASGLASEHPAIAAVSARALPSNFDVDALDQVPTRERLLASLPRLRMRRLEYAVTEAMLRREAAETWPQLRIGPKLMLQPDMTLPGGVVGLELPWPGSAQGRIAAAVETRSAAREALEDEFLAATADVTQARQRFVARVDDVEHHLALADATSIALRAGRARFRADAAMLESWVMAIDRRIDAQMKVLESEEAAALARIDFDEAVGPKNQPETRATDTESRP